MKHKLKRPIALLLTVVMLLGLLPTASFAAEPGSGLGFTTLTLGSTDLLTSDQMELDGYTAYTLNMDIQLPAGSEDTILTVTLPEGMKFVGLNPENLKSDAVASANWVKGEAVYGYQPDNGTLTVVFAEGRTSTNLQLSIQPDMAFFPIENKNTGISISDGIQLSLTATGYDTVEKAVAVNCVTSRGIIDPRFEVPTSNKNISGLAGGESTLFGNFYPGIFAAGQEVTKRLVDKVEYVFSVPKEITYVSGLTGNATITTDVSDPDNTDNNLWTISQEDIYASSASYYLKIGISKDAEIGDIYTLKPIKVSSWSYGMEEPYLKEYKETDELWTITVKDPTAVELTTEALPSNKVYNYTANGSETGEFDGYNTILGSAIIRNVGASDIKAPLIYEAVFDTTMQLVTAVGIPCNPEGETGWPTMVTVTDDQGQTFTLDTGALKKAASLVDKTKGFVLRAENIEGFDETRGIAGVTAELPGLPYGYSSIGLYPFNEGHITGGGLYSGAWGRIRQGQFETGATVENQYRICEKGMESESVFVKSSTTLAEDIYIVVADTLESTLSKNSITSNETVHIEQSIQPNRFTEKLVGSTIILEPVVYLMEPADLLLRNVKFTDKDGNTLGVKRTEVQSEKLADGWKLWEYRFTDQLLLGWWSKDWEAEELQLSFDYAASPTASTVTYNLQQLIFYKSGKEFAFSRNTIPDTYGVNGGKPLGRVESKSFTVNAAQDLNISSAFRVGDEGEWITYDGTANTLGLFGSNTTAQIKVSVQNALGRNLDTAEIYIPVPKKDLDLGDGFGKSGQFDMYVAAAADLTGADGWSVKYGVVNEAPKVGQAPTPDSGGWQTSFSDQTNMIQLSMSGGMADGTAAEIILTIRATDDAGQTDSKNEFKSWYLYQYGKDSAYDSKKDCNFGALLQNGALSGTVFADLNRDGVKDNEEAGVSGVTVTVNDGARDYTTTTDSNGGYQFNNLPGKQNLTVTIENPRSNDPNSAYGSYRFSTAKASSGDTIGTDVVSQDEGRTATATLTLANQNKVNAGLIEPYEVQFQISGENSIVNPSKLKIFQGQTLGDVTERITVNPEMGLEFLNKWTVLMNGQSTEVEHADILDLAITGDATITAQTKSMSNDVTAMWWNQETGKSEQQFTETVNWAGYVSASFPQDAVIEASRPGYNFTGWSVNGTEQIRTRAQITGTPVTGAVNYIAQYAPRTDISVTLDANGGAWGEVKTQTKDNLTYTGTVAYDQPVREGYTFIGWSEDKNATKGEMSLAVPAESGKTFYAVWEAGDVRVTLMPNGGSFAEGQSDTITGKVGGIVTLPGADKITHEGYTLKGWVLQGDPTGKVLNGSYTLPTKDAILVAQWDAAQESITFKYSDTDKGITANDVTITGPHGAALNDIAGAVETVNNGVPSSATYSLTGWMSEDGTIVPHANIGSITINQGDTYTAIWQEGTASLKFNANGGQFADGTDSMTFTDVAGKTLAASAIPTPTQEGKTFLGWFAAATGGEAATSFTYPAKGGTMTYYAQWEDAKYTVTFNFNGGKLADDAGAVKKEITVTHGGSVAQGDIPTLTLDQSTFQGWRNLTTGALITDLSQIAKAEVTADVIYNAEWSGNRYTVSFSNVDESDPTAAAVEVTVTEGAAPAAPVPQPVSGHVFLHWKDLDSGATYTAEQLSKLAVKSNMRLMAVYGEDSYTITFINTNGDIQGNATITKQGGSVLAAGDFPIATSNDENKFIGWYYNGETKTAEQWAGTTVNSDMSFIASFEGKVTVTFDRMGGDWTEEGEKEFASGLEGNASDKITLPTGEHLTRTGYTFGGWYTSTDFAEDHKAGSTFPQASMTYYAKWTPVEIQVTFKNGDDVIQTVTKNYGETLTANDIPTNVTKPGYKLVGWTNPDGLMVPSASMEQQVVNKVGGMTYTAYFEANPYKITFEANGGTFPGDDAAAEKVYERSYGNTMPFADVPVPSQTGKEFVGWQLEGESSGTTQGSMTFDADKTYVAVWKDAVHTIRFLLGGGAADGAVNGVVTKTVAYGGTFPEAPEVAYTGNTLRGWLDIDSTDGKLVENWPDTVTGDKTYIAQWENATYTVKFTNIDGTDSSKSFTATVVYDQVPPAPNTTPAPGYVFDYWNVVSPADGLTIDGESGKKTLTADELTKLHVTQDIQLSASYKTTGYTVTFNANGGTFAEGATTSYTAEYNQTLKEVSGFAAPKVEKAGAEFLGWTRTGDNTLYTNNTDSDNYIGNVQITETTVFIASWSGNVRVTFNANGGEITGADYAEGQTGTTISSVPTPTRYGYTFGGWYTDSTCNTPAGEDGTYKFPVTSATWYAKWTPKTVTITYDFGEGSVGGDKSTTMDRPFGGQVVDQTEELPKPTRAGWTLIGWINPDGLIVPIANMSSQTVNDEAGMTFTAYYQQNTVAVQFDPNGGTFPDGTAEAKSYSQAVGGQMNLADVPVPSKAAMDFQGWKLEGADDSTALKTGTVTFDTAKTYEAVWADAEYTVTFHLNGGAVNGNENSVVYEGIAHNTAFPSVPAPTMTGQNLIGWMNMEDGKTYGKQYDQDNEAFPTTVTGNATYVALWNTQMFDVTFVGYEQSSPEATRIVPVVYGYAPPAPATVANGGYAFKHWQVTVPTGGVTIDGKIYTTLTADQLTELEVTQAITLKAVFEETAYTVTFDSNGGEWENQAATSFSVAYNQKLSSAAGFSMTEPTLDGSEFEGWVIVGVSSDKVYTTDELGGITITGPTVIRAKWEGDVTVSFNAMGGELIGSDSASGQNGAEIPNVPSASKTGYTFGGWYLDQKGEKPAFEGTADAPTYKFPAQTATWYAKWDPIDVEVQFKLAEDGEAVHSATVKFGNFIGTDNLPSDTITQKPGWTLTMWTREDGLRVPKDNMAAQIVDDASGMTFVAYYEQNTVQIDFAPNGGVFPDGTDDSKTYEKSQGGTMPFADVPVPSRTDGYQFAGWSETLDGEAVSDESMTFDTEKTYYAKWVPATYTVKFLLNGGSATGEADGAVTYEGVTHNSNYPKIPTVTLAGNSLQGWMDMSTGKMYGDKDGQENFPSTVTADATYIAIWGADSYDVTFIDYNNGTGSLAVNTIYLGVPAAPVITPPTGKQFVAWEITSGTLQAKNGDTLSTGATVTSDALTECKVIGAVTLKATYEDPYYTVTFNPGEGATLIGDATYQVANGKNMDEMGFTVPKAEKQGAASESWICGLDGKTMTSDEVAEMVINSHVTFTALWIGDVRVTFNANGGTINGQDYYEGQSGETIPEASIPTPVRAGYTFQGWVDEDGNKITEHIVPASDETWYAQWAEGTLVIADIDDQTYIGEAITPDLTVTYNDGETDAYEAEWEHNTDAGTARVTITGTADGDFEGVTATKTFTIHPRDISEAAFEDIADQTYTGLEVRPDVSGTYNSKPLTVNEDYHLTYEDNIDVGTATVTIHGEGNFTGEAAVTFEIVAKTTAPVIQKIPAQNYTDEPIEPTVVIKDGRVTLTEGEDYTVEYTNNTNVGTATVTVTYLGNYESFGTATATFQIVSRKILLDVTVEPKQDMYEGEEVTITVELDGETLTEDTDYELSYETYDEDGNLVSADAIEDAGVYVITATGVNDYEGASGSTVFVRLPMSVEGGLILEGVGDTDFVYDGEDHRDILNDLIVKLVNDQVEPPEEIQLTDEDYTLSVSYNNGGNQDLDEVEIKNVGVYVVTVKASGNYDANNTATLTIVITPRDISTVDVEIDETTYDATEQTAGITVSDGGNTLTEGVDYTVENTSYTDANEDGYEVTITGMGNYTGTTTGQFIIHRAEITVEHETISITYGDPLPELDPAAFTITGICAGDEGLVTVTPKYPSDLSAGTHTFEADLTGERAHNYVVDASGAVIEVSRKDMNGEGSGVTAELNRHYGYYDDGKPVPPTVVVRDSKLNKTLTQDVDYEVSYLDADGDSVSAPAEIGDYTVIVEGKGSYTGRFELSYEIREYTSGGGGGGGGGTTRYTITAEAGKGGSISPDGKVRVDRGDDQTFRIKADEGYEIEDVIVDGESVGAVSKYTFEDVRESHTIEVEFVKSADPDIGTLPFVDVPRDAYYYDAVYWAVANGITSGTSATTFSPDQSCTRAQMVTFLWRAAGSPAPKNGVNPFTDVQPGAYYYDAVLWAVEQGITSGTSATTFSPDATVTRGQTVTFLWRANGAPVVGGSSFTDVSADAYYAAAVAWAVSEGVTSGTGNGMFSPDADCTRAQIVTFMYRAAQR